MSTPLTPAQKEALRQLDAAARKALPTTRQGREGFLSGACAAALERKGLVRYTSMSGPWSGWSVKLTPAGEAEAEMLR